jgi:hypothetical protein
VFAAIRSSGNSNTIISFRASLVGF